MWVAAIMNTRSEWFEKVNFAAAERIERIQSITVLLNITRGCWKHFYGPPAGNEIKYEPISIMDINGMLSIFVIMTIATIGSLIIEIVYDKYHNKISIATHKTTKWACEIDLSLTFDEFAVREEFVKKINQVVRDFTAIR